jgi:hypothetical protein
VPGVSDSLQGWALAAEAAFWLMFWKFSPFIWSGDCGGVERKGRLAEAKVLEELPASG